MHDEALKFRGKHTQALGFGTSGLRGLVTDMTDLECYLNTTGFLEYLLEAEPGVPRRVALGGDLRPSTDSPDRSLLRAVARAARDAGFEVIHCGKLPTPALAYFAFERGLPSIMVTGSHIPFDRNGIKFNMPGREVLKADEEPILRAVARVRCREYQRPSELSPFADDGMFKAGAAPALPEVEPSALESYRRRYLDFFPERALAGLSIAVYQHSAVGRDLLCELLAELGAAVHPMGRSDTFVAIDTEAVNAARLRELQSLLDEATARFGNIDAIVSTDGDSDRPLLVGVGASREVHFIGGDLLGMLVAEYLQADAVAVPVSATDAIDVYFSGKLKLVRTRIGSPWVIAAMQRLEGKRIVGWEANGGFLVASPIEREGRRLRPLATRDALLPLICALHAARVSGCAIVELPERLPKRFSQAGLIDVPPERLSLLAKHYVPAIAGLVRADFRSDPPEWWDQAGEQHRASSDEAALLEQVRARLAEQLGPEQGFGLLVQLDYTDGVRTIFDNGDVAHFRASGNAPQLRMYSVANSPARARQIVEEAVASGGTLEALLAAAEEGAFVRAVLANIAHTEWLFRQGDPAALIGAVSGSLAAQRYWQRSLDAMRVPFQARHAISLHEDLPTNQAFGLLLMWQRVRSLLGPGEGALLAFVFGEGSRATPFTEAESAQKPAISCFVRSGSAPGSSFQSMVALAMQCFAPVEAFLRRSGFDGVVVKWGDEVQIPARDLSGTNQLFRQADIVRFVSMRVMTESDAKSKDWVGVDAEGRVTGFIPRRPLSEMRSLADRGLLQARGDALVGGINLGSIAVSRVLLDALLAEFTKEVNDPSADRGQRPDLDPQFFTVLMIALIDDDRARAASYEQAVQEVPALAQLARKMPDLLDRLRRTVLAFRAEHGRAPRVVAMDFGDQYWGDIGQHQQIYRFFMALNEAGAEGHISRALAGLDQARDAHGNLVTPDSSVSEGIQLRRSVLIGAELFGSGLVEDCVLVGTRAGNITARQAFDVGSVVSELALAPRAGTYKVISGEAVTLEPGERATLLFLPDGREALLRVHEQLDLRDRARHYDVPVSNNPLSFRQAHQLMGEVAAEELENRRSERARAVLARISRSSG